MRLPQVFIDEFIETANLPTTIEIAVVDAHHLHHVLRKTVGDSVQVIDKEGVRYLSEIEEISKGKTKVKILRPQETLIEQLTDFSPEVTLFQAPPRGKRFDTAIRPLSELGLHRLVPVECTRGVYVFISFQSVNAFD